MRNTGTTSDKTKLSFQLLKNGLPYKASSLVSLAVYSTESGYLNSETPICTINTSTGVLVTSTGLYTYEVPVINTAGIYYDVIGLNVKSSSPTSYFVNAFTLVDETFSGSPIAAEPMCAIYGYIKTAGAVPVAGVRVAAYPDDVPAIDDITNNGIMPQDISVYTDSSGYFSLSLIQNVVYRIAIREMAFYTKINVPIQSTCELWQLTSINEIGEAVVTSTGTVVTSTGTVITTSTGTVIPDPSW